MDPDWVTGYMSDLRFLKQLWCATLSIVLARAERIGIWLLHGSAVWAAVPSPSLNDRGRASAAWWLVTSDWTIMNPPLRWYHYRHHLPPSGPSASGHWLWVALVFWTQERKYVCGAILTKSHILFNIEDIVTGCCCCCRRVRIKPRNLKSLWADKILANGPGRTAPCRGTCNCNKIRIKILCLASARI